MRAPVCLEQALQIVDRGDTSALIDLARTVDRRVAIADKAESLLGRAGRALARAASGARARVSSTDPLDRALVMIAMAARELESIDPAIADALDHNALHVPTRVYADDYRAIREAARQVAARVELARAHLHHRIAELRWLQEGLASALDSERRRADLSGARRRGDGEITHRPRRTARFSVT